MTSGEGSREGLVRSLWSLQKDLGQRPIVFVVEPVFLIAQLDINQARQEHDLNMTALTSATSKINKQTRTKGNKNYSNTPTAKNYERQARQWNMMRDKRETK